MITKLAKGTACFFSANNIIEKEDEEVYSYGMELVLSAAVNIIISIVVAILTHTVLATFVFLVSFMVLRQVIGGYHAKTHFRCNGILVGILIVFACINTYLPTQSYIYINLICMVVSLVVIIKFAPVAHPNKPMTADKIHKLKLKSRVIAALMSVLILVLVVADLMCIGLWVSTAMLCASTAMRIEIISQVRKTARINRLKIK